MNLEKPYWIEPIDDLPFHDFNKEIAKPGSAKSFPEGAVALRVDDDFFIVAVLPYVHARTPVDSLVYEVFPELKGKPEGFVTFGPDVEYRAD